MPHSSGGGSSSGGFSSSGGGSSSTGGSSSGSSGVKPIRDSYYDGCRTYVSYESGAPKFRYYDPKGARIYKINAIFMLVLMFAFAIPLFWMGTMFLKVALKPVEKVTYPSETDEWTVIDDQADSFTSSEEDAIGSQLKKFYMMTGIRTEVETITEETFEKAKKDSLEIYAYAEYVNLYYDETRWLIVFLDKGGGEWEFHGMQGDDTDPFLTISATDEFDRVLTENLWSTSRYSYGQAFEEAFKVLNTRMEKTVNRKYNSTETAIGFIFILVSLVLMILGIRTVKKGFSTQKRIKKGGYHLVDNPRMMSDEKGKKVPLLVTCPYCRGTYVFGETVCPHCGAPGAVKTHGDEMK